MAQCHYSITFFLGSVSHILIHLALSMYDFLLWYFLLTSKDLALGFLSLSPFLSPALISPLSSLAPRSFLATGPARFVIAALLASSAASLPQDPSWACHKHGLTLLVLNFVVKSLILVLSVLRNIF